MLTIHEVTESFKAVYGFDPSYTYCLITGKPIGFMFPEEMESLIAQLGSDLESVCDDLRLRSLASMRPSLKWNRMREESLADMRRNAPVETMAYLVNRLMTPPKDAKNSADFAGIHGDRILMFQHLLAQRESKFWDSVMHMLLEIEAKISLVPERCPFDWEDLLDSEGNAAQLLENMHTLLTPWHARKVAAHAKAEQEAKFFAANPGARRAFYDSVMETQPVTPATQAKREKQQTVNFMGAILDELMDTVSPMKPAAMRPATVHVAQPVKLQSTKMRNWGAAKKAAE